LDLIGHCLAGVLNAGGIQHQSAAAAVAACTACVNAALLLSAVEFSTKSDEKRRFDFLFATRATRKPPSEVPHHLH